MTIKVRINCDDHDSPGVYASHVMDIVREMRKKGYAQGIDFDFAFVPVEIDPNSYETIEEKHTMFVFYKEEIATWFSLTYQ